MKRIVIKNLFEDYGLNLITDGPKRAEAAGSLTRKNEQAFLYLNVRVPGQSKN
jgi:hypothetical protein